MSRISIKIIFTIVLCVLIVSTFIGLFSQNIASRIINDEASEKFYNISRSYANEFSLLFCTISSTTDTLALNIGLDLDIDVFVADSDYRDQMMQKADKKIKTLGEQASDIQGIYVVFDPELTNQVYESWFIDDGQGNFVYQTPEDISLFYPDNEDMAWYYDPIRAGQGVWSEPYTDATINIEMISYTTPIWIDNQIIGVAGIDISFESILETMENMTFYDAGYPFLIDQDYNIISHPELDNGTSLYDIENGNLRVITDSLDDSPSGIVSYTYKNTDKMLGYSRLTNGWYFLASTELQEIQSPLQELTKMIFLVSSVIALIALMIGLKLSSNITKPLNQLIQYTNQISTGNYNIEHKENRNDEIGLLLNSFKQMSQEIHSSQTELEALSNDMTYQAYHDTLTRLANRRFAQKRLHELIDTYSETLDITGLMIIDLNDFKSINDSYGHNAGDQVLIHATEMMLHCISDKDELFRFGGDEFLLIFRELPSIEHVEKLTSRLWSSVKRPLQLSSKLVQVSASIGVTIINQDNLDYDTILAQADIAMYEAKKQPVPINFTMNSNILKHSSTEALMDILNYIDDNTLIYAVVATYFSAFLIFMLLKQHYGTQLTKRLKYGYLLLGIGFLLIGLRAYIPDFFTIILANLMTITGSYFVVAGYLCSTEIVIKARLFSIPIFIFLLVHLYFTYIQNNTNVRIINYSAFMILVMLIYCYHAIKYLIRKFESAYLIILITYIIYMLYHLYRLLNAIKSQLFLELFRDAPIFKGFLLVSFFVEITRILILMIHKANTHMVEENQS